MKMVTGRYDRPCESAEHSLGVTYSILKLHVLLAN